MLIIPVSLSCGGYGEEEYPAGSTSSTGPGTVAVFITDNISSYKQVIATVNSVSLVDSGTMTVCTVLKTPATLDLSNLTNVAQFVDAGDCPSGLYNRIDIRFQREVQLMDQQDTPSACRFTSYFDENNRQKPLPCDSPSGECSMSIRGAVRQGAVQVLSGRTSDLGIDFDLKQFTVAGFGDPHACSAAMKVYSVDAASLNSSGRAHGVTGSITNLDVSAKTFTLTKAGRLFFVDYSAIIPALQPGIDMLLQAAVDDRLSVKVLGSSINPAAGTITASRVFVKVEGDVSDLLKLPDWTFTLTYQGKIMPVSYKQPAVIDGTLADGAWVAVSLDGYRSGEYLVSRAEVLPSGMIIED